MSGILMDTNILVYLVDQNDPGKQNRAKEVLGALESHHTGCLSVQNLAEFMNVSTHKLQPKLTPDQALEWINQFIQIWPLLDLTSEVVLEAARAVCDYNLAYYDAQIWAAARLNQVTLILSEDFQDGIILEEVRFLNPFTPGFDINHWI